MLGDPELMDEILIRMRELFPRGSPPEEGISHDSTAVTKAMIESLPDWNALPSGLREATLRAALAADRFRAQSSQSVLDSTCAGAIQVQRGELPNIPCVDACTKAAILSMFGFGN